MHVPAANDCPVYCGAVQLNRCARTISLLVILLAAVISAPSLLRAQTPSETAYFNRLNATYLEHKSAGRWNDAAKTAEDMLDFIQQKGLSPSLKLTVLDMVALSRVNQGQLEEGLSLYKKIIEEAPKIRPGGGQDRDWLRNARINSLNGAAHVTRRFERYEESMTYLRQASEFAARIGDTIELARARIELGLVLSDMGETDQAIEEMLAAIPVLERAAPRERPTGYINSSYANALHALGNAYHNKGRFDLAAPYHRRALNVSVRHVGWNHSFTALIASSLAGTFHDQGRVAEAALLYQAAIYAYEATVGREHPRCAAALNNLARLIEYQGNHVDAEAMGREAVRIKRLFYDADHPEVAISMLNLANILSHQDRFDEAKPLANKALNIFQELGTPRASETAECLQLLATIHTEESQHLEALELLDQAQTIKERTPFAPDQAAKLHVARAIVLQALKRVEEAAKEMDRGLALLDVQRSYASGTERERASLLENYAVFYDGAIEYRAELDDAMAMFRIVESMKARAFLDELRTSNVDLLEGLSDDERQRIQEEETDLRRRLSEAEARFDALPDLGLDASEEQLAQRKDAAQEIFAARDALYQHLADVKAASPAYRELITNQTDTASLEDVQASLDDGELLLSYAVGGYHSYVIVARCDRAYFAELLVDESAAALFGIEAGEFTRDKLAGVLLSEKDGMLSVLSSTKQPPEGFNSKLAALWQILVPEVEREALTSGDVRQLTILPAGSLALLPFEALVVSDSESPVYLLDVGPSIAYAPSASVLLNLATREGEHRRASEPVLTLGDPAYSEPSEESQDVISRFMSTAGSANQFRATLSRLPFSGWEATWIAEHFEKAGVPSVKLTRTEATEGALRRKVPGREIVHLACHGMAGQSYANFFGNLALAPGRRGDPSDDGVLSMSEIYGLELDGCELAILSACQTNYGPQQQGEGVWALSRGFLVAGARRVVASNWVVDDEAGATLVSYFASHLAKSRGDISARDYATALQKAKRQVRRNPRWVNPFYWSSLVLVGPK